MSRFANLIVRIPPILIGWALAVARLHAQESDAHAQVHEPNDAHHAAAHAHSGDASKGQASDSAEQPPTDHVAPPPPQHPMESMTDREMAVAMEMDDAAPVAVLRFDRLERFDGDDGAGAAWKFGASVGSDFDKLVVRSEGERVHGAFEQADAEALWSHAVASYWDAQVGLRRDFGRGADRTWAAFGVQGLAPYWFEVGAAFYVGDAGRTALRFEVDYDLLLTQRLILQPRVEVNAYGKSDHTAEVRSGLSDGQLGLRLRYEVRRELAPYVGIERSWLFGGGGDSARNGGEDVEDTKYIVGLHVWF